MLYGRGATSADVAPRPSGVMSGSRAVYMLLGGLAVGVVVGLWLPAAAPVADVLGRWYMNALRLTAGPLVAASVWLAVADLRAAVRGRALAVTSGWFLATTVAAAALGAFLCLLVQPGVGLGRADRPVPVLHRPGVVDALGALVPPNLFAALAGNDVLGVLLTAIVFGLGTASLGERAAPLRAVVASANELMMWIVERLAWVAPVGVAALVAARLGYEGGAAFADTVAAVGAYSAVVIGGCVLHASFVLAPAVGFVARRSIADVFIASLPALTNAFATASSNATLPTTLAAAARAGVAPATARLVIPLGATVNMDGTALYEAVAALFIAQAYGIALGPGGTAVVIATAVLASIGAAGIPQAGLVTMSLVLSAAGLPLEGIGLLLSVDWFLDRVRTTVNVWGDLVAATVVDRFVPTEREA